MEEDCPLCASPRRALLAGERRYRSCPSCGWIALDRDQVLSPEAQKARYVTHENTPDNAGYVSMFRDFLASCVDPFVEPPGRALDFGCGPLPEGGVPVLAGLLRARGFAADFFDPFFAPDPSWKTARYDLVTLTEVLEHLEDPLAVLREARERLSGRGVLALMTRFHPEDEGGFTDWWYRRDPTHVSFYSPRTLRRLADRLGMRVLFMDEDRHASLGVIG